MITIGKPKYSNISRDISSTGIWNSQEVFAAKLNNAWPQTVESLTVQTTFEKNDIVILFNYAWNTTSIIPTSAIPLPGFTAVSNVAVIDGTSFASRSIISYKVYTTNDTVNLPAGAAMGGSGGTRTTILTLRPDFSKFSTSQNVLSLNAEATASDPVAQALNMSTISTATNPVIGIAHYAASSNVATRTSTGASMTEIINPSGNQYVKYIIYNKGSTPANITIDMPDTGVNTLQSFALQIV